MPKGTLDNRWNVIAYACEPCNRVKADLEDDLSAITMQPDVFGKHATSDPRLATEARRKGGGSGSRRTGKPVAKSTERFSIELPMMPGVIAKFSIVGGPQADEDRVYRLARFHLAGFFSFITFNKETHRGYFWPGGFFPFIYVPKTDWGNPTMRGFAEQIKLWPNRFWHIGAEGFFKALIRRAPGDVDLWAWVLEWNANYRVAGFFGDEGSARRTHASLPDPGSKPVDATTRYRIEQALPESEDTLFADPSGAVSDES